jgi:uncharacterized protein YuzE
MMNEDVSEKITMKYDSTADTLSLHFGEPQAVHDSEITKEGVVVRLREGKIVTVSILHAHRRIHEALKGQA